MSIDLKTAGAVLGLLSVLGAAAGGYSVLRYRVDALEAQQAQRVEAERGVLLLICKVHDVDPCPVMAR